MGLSALSTAPTSRPAARDSTSGSTRVTALAVSGLLAVGVGLVAWYVTAPPRWAQAPVGSDPTPQAQPALPTPQPSPHRARPNFIETVGIRPDAARNKALYDLLDGADRRRIEDLLGQVRDLPASPHRTDVVRILYIHMASTDPAAAVDHVLAVRHQPSWLAAVFRVWAHADFDAAVRRAKSLDASPKGVVARALLEMDLASWQQDMIAEHLDAGMLLTALRTREELASGTPEQAWTNALSLPAGGQQDRRLGMAALAWAKEDPAAALRAIGDFAGDAARWMAGRVMADWAKSDRPAALRWLSEQEVSDRAKSQAWMLAAAIAETDINAALDAIDQMPAWAQPDAKAAILGSWLRADLPAVLEWFAQQPLADQQSFRYTVARAFARHDPEQALRWALNVDYKVREGILDAVFRSIDDQTTAEKLFRRIDDPELRDGLVWQLHFEYAPDDPEAALRWADGFDPAARDELRALTFRKWAERDPDGATRAVLRYKAPALRDVAAADVISGLLYAFHVEAAERLFNMIETADARRSAAIQLHLYFTNTDPNPAKAATYLAIMNS